MLLLICAAVVADTATPVEEIAFTYAPPDGVSYVEKCKIVDTIRGTNFPMMTYTMNNNKKVELTKTDSGYKLTSTPLDVDAKWNGHPLPPDMLISEKVITRQAAHTCEIDANGRLLSVDGLDTFFKQLQDIVALRYPMGAKQLASMAPVLKQGVETEIKDEWLDRITAFTGKTAKVGELWKTQDKFEAYSGSLTVNIRTRFVERVTKNGHECLHLRFFYATDPVAVKAEIKGAINDLITSMNLPPCVKLPKVVSAELTGTGDRYVDPATMLIYAETQTVNFKMVMDVPREGRMTIVRDGKEDYSYEYTMPKTD
jgi:hypothetical protein